MSTTESQVELVNIYEELTRLWDQEQGEKKTRASLFTLILFVQKSERFEFYDSLIKSVVSKFPCRVIAIISDEGPDKEYLRTTVKTQTITEGELQIFCELIRLEVAGSLIERVPFIVTPQILPDLPVYLLWTKDPAAESSILPHLEPLADRIIFDSESTHDLQAYAHCVSSLLCQFHCAIGDLNWSATSSWRHIFRQVFDTYDSFINLVQSKLIRIYYNRNPSSSQQHTEIEAAYLQAWIASRLNWKFQAITIDEGNIRLTYRRPTNEVIVLLIPQEAPHLNPGTLLNIEIECEHNQAHYTFKRHPESRQAFIQFSDQERCDLPYCTFLTGIEEGQEILQEIFYPSIGTHYREMLDVLTHIPWKR